MRKYVAFIELDGKPRMAELNTENFSDAIEFFEAMAHSFKGRVLGVEDRELTEAIEKANDVQRESQHKALSEVVEKLKAEVQDIRATAGRQIQALREALEPIASLTYRGKLTDKMILNAMLALKTQ